MHLYKEHAKDYLEAGFSVIPDRFQGKMPLIKGWNEYSFRLPSQENVNNWVESFDKSNIALCLGETSGIVALDFDCIDESIIKVVEDILPDSPCEKVGSKGWTRFFRYRGEINNNVSFNGKVVMEILSNSKKTTIPPSIHPNGASYTWTGKTLLDVNKEDLPFLPPRLLESIRHELKLAFPTTEIQGHKLVNGRNDALSKYCSKLIAYSTAMDEAIAELIKYDKENHEIPLFTDVSEYTIGHTEEFTNAAKFYINHLDSFNRKAMRENTEYEKPTTAHAINFQLKQEAELQRLKKSQSEEPTEKLVLELPKPTGALAVIQEFILENSYIEQPAFALSAAISLIAALAGGKYELEGVAPNVYLCNVALSGSGKDAPQQKVKEIISLMGLQNSILGSGDYVSDASLMDGLETNPVRLDIIDEAGGMLRTVNQGGASFNTKMADVLAELFSCSSSIYLGRRTAEGEKGKCIRPNVNLLCSTTPTAFKEGVSTEAIEKGLMGRFLLFLGENGKASRRLESQTFFKDRHINKLNCIINFKPKENKNRVVDGIKQCVYELQSTPTASDSLEKVFEEFDKKRRESDENNKLLPIISRLYQMVLKITMIHCLSRMETKDEIPPKINKKDVAFAKDLVIYCFQNMKDTAEKHIFRNRDEENVTKVEAIIIGAGEDGIKHTALVQKTRFLKKPTRDQIVDTLVESGVIFLHFSEKGGKIYTGVKNVRTWNK